MFGLGKFLVTTGGAHREFGPVTVHGYNLSCQVCRHGEFWEHHVQLHTPVATLFNLEIFNQVANCAVCAKCGYVHFFLPTDTGLQESDSDETQEAGPAP